MLSGGAALAAVKDPGDEAMPLYEGVYAIKATLGIPDSNWAQCYAHVTLSAGYTADAELTLMRQASGSTTWTPVKTWNDDQLPIEIETEWHVSEGYTYKLELNVRVYNSAGICVENPVKYSNIVSN